MRPTTSRGRVIRRSHATRACAGRFPCRSATRSVASRCSARTPTTSATTTMPGSRGLEFGAGTVFDDVYDAVLGADVARELNLRLNDPLVVAHGAVDVDSARHSDKPFRVVGILRKTGTPVDRTVHVSLEGLEAIHVDWQSGMRAPAAPVSADEARRQDLTPRSITAFLSGWTLGPRSSTCSVSSMTIGRNRCSPCSPASCCRNCGTRSGWRSGPCSACPVSSPWSACAGWSRRS